MRSIAKVDQLIIDSIHVKNGSSWQFDFQDARSAASMDGKEKAQELEISKALQALPFLCSTGTRAPK